MSLENTDSIYHAHSCVHGVTAYRRSGLAQIKKSTGTERLLFSTPFEIYVFLRQTIW